MTGVQTCALPSRGAVRFDYVVGAGRCADSTTRTVQVFGTTVAAGNDIALCDTATAAFQLNGATPVGGTWSGSVAVSPTGVFTPSVSGAGRHVLTYTFRETAAGCRNSATRTVTVNRRPKAIISADSFGCKGLIVNVNGQNSTDADRYNWTFGDEIGRAHV